MMNLIIHTERLYTIKISLTYMCSTIQPNENPYLAETGKSVKFLWKCKEPKSQNNSGVEATDNVWILFHAKPIKKHLKIFLDCGNEILDQSASLLILGSQSPSLPLSPFLSLFLNIDGPLLEKASENPFSTWWLRTMAFFMSKLKDVMFPNLDVKQKHQYN